MERFKDRILERALRQDPKYTRWEDKVEAYQIARDHGVRTPRVYQVCRRGEEIDFAALPPRYVVKPNHFALGIGVFAMDRGVNRLDGKRYGEAQIRTQMDALMARTYGGERSQEAIERRILVEELLRPEDGSDSLPDDYKCYVFGGRVELIEVVRRRGPRGWWLLRRFRRPWSATVHFLTPEWQPTPQAILLHEPGRDQSPGPRPRCLPELIAAAERLGAAFGEFLRVDLYATDQGAVFGEFTVHPYGGSFFSEYGNRLLGELWQRPDR